MHALNIMWLLNEIDCNTEIKITTWKSECNQWIEVATEDFDFTVDEDGVCVLKYLGQPKSVEKDIEYWNKVKNWVKKYYQESF